MRQTRKYRKKKGGFLYHPGALRHPTPPTTLAISTTPVENQNPTTIVQNTGQTNSSVVGAPAPVSTSSNGNLLFKNAPVNPNNIIKQRRNYINASNNATKIRSKANALTTVGMGFQKGLLGLQFLGALSTAKIAVLSGTAATAATFPPLLAALFGTYMISLFVMRQVGLNRELMANLYIIKAEIGRMQCVYEVMKVISQERGIDLNTASLSAIIINLGKKIMTFAGPDTVREIENMETLLSRGYNIESIKTKISELEKEVDRRAIAIASGNQPLQGGGRTFMERFRSWKARWLSPAETLRQIIRDVTIAVIWFSIMLGEFDLFNRYADIMNMPKAVEWVKSPEMYKLMIANQQLGKISASGIKDVNQFYKIIDTPVEFLEAFKNVKDALKTRDATLKALDEEQKKKEQESANHPTGNPTVLEDDPISQTSPPQTPPLQTAGYTRRKKKYRK